MVKLFKIGSWDDYGSYRIVMAKTEQEALEKANKKVKEANEEMDEEDYYKSYSIEDVSEHDSDVWFGEWA